MSLINDALKRAREAERKNKPAGPMGIPVTAAPVERLKKGFPVLSMLLLVALLGGAVVTLVIWNKPGGEIHVAQASPKQIEEGGAVNSTSIDGREAQPEKPEAKDPVEVLSPIVAVVNEPTTEPLIEQPVLAEVENVFQDMPILPKETTTPEAEAAKLRELMGEKAAGNSKAGEPESTPAEVSESPPLFSAPKPPAVKPEGEPVVAEFPLLKVQGIFYSKSNPSVIIDRQLLRKGDEISGAKVVDIQPQSVTLEFEGQRRTLNL